MPIFQVGTTELRPVSVTSSGAEGVLERRDLQRLLRQQIGVLDEDLLVVAEEFGDWLDSSRRIDLLCLDSSANLVVVELKRSEDGGHMDLQALRYAAMVSSMTFGELVHTYARYAGAAQPDPDAAKSVILDFLGWEDVYEDRFGQDTRIVLAAADFSKELTTTVMWLIEYGIDIRCIRMKPYRMADGPLLLDIQQIIPLPEAAAFQTKIGVKRLAERQNRSERHELRYRFWEGLLSCARTKTDLHAGRKPNDSTWISGGIGRTGFSLNYAIRQEECQAELWISLGQQQKSKEAFEALFAQKAEIEAAFGGPLDWQAQPEKEGSRIRYLLDRGYRAPLEQWSALQTELVDAMIRLDRALRQRVAALKI